jgi:VanZ family protein
LVCWPFYKINIDSKKKIRYFIIIALLTSVFGYCTELMQKYWAEGRTYDLMDWLADSTGALGAFVFCRLFFISKKQP